jgi:hypothetical protein
MRPLLFLFLVAMPAQARDLMLALPIDCVPGESCFVQNYVDADPGPGAADFTCGPQTYDGHKGTDFALISDAQMEAGVNVLAAAPGTVKAVRDGMADANQSLPGAPDIKGRECGNGVLIDHGGGWTTQYCHMREGSIAVAPGRRVGAGTVLGQVGLSGQTEFAHVHITLRHDDAVVDPFDPDGIVRCLAPPGPTLWTSGLGYDSGGLIAIGVSDHVPDYAEMPKGTAGLGRLDTAMPALVVWGYLYGTRTDDVLHLTLDGPGGSVVDQTVRLEKAQARAYRAAGKKAHGPWQPGTYKGSVTIERNGKTIAGREIELEMD